MRPGEETAASPYKGGASFPSPTILPHQPAATPQIQGQPPKRCLSRRSPPSPSEALTGPEGASGSPNGQLMGEVRHRKWRGPPPRPIDPTHQWAAEARAGPQPKRCLLGQQFFTRTDGESPAATPYHRGEESFGRCFVMQATVSSQLTTVSGKSQLITVSKKKWFTQ